MEGNTMIKEIQFVQYKKLKNISLSFDSGLNAISGENGTCKSSLLYLISNSYQAVTPKCDWVKDASVLGVLRAVNMVTNPKIESLQRKEYSNPAPEVQGTLYTVKYYDHESEVIEGEKAVNGWDKFSMGRCHL